MLYNGWYSSVLWTSSVAGNPQNGRAAHSCTGTTPWHTHFHSHQRCTRTIPGHTHMRLCRPLVQQGVVFLHRRKGEFSIVSPNSENASLKNNSTQSTTRRVQGCHRYPLVQIGDVFLDGTMFLRRACVGSSHHVHASRESLNAWELSRDCHWSDEGPGLGGDVVALGRALIGSVWPTNSVDLAWGRGEDSQFRVHNVQYMDKVTWKFR